MVQRYGRAPETVGQWNEMNGFTSGAEHSVNPALLPHDDPRRIAWTKQQDDLARGGGANNTAGAGVVNALQPGQKPSGMTFGPGAQQPQGPGGAVMNAMQPGLQGILDQIDKVYSGQNNVAMQEAQRAMAGRGLGRGDGAGNALFNDALNRVGASKSNAVMNAMLGQQGQEAQQQRFAQELQLERERFANSQAQSQREFDYRKQQDDASRQQEQRNFDYRKQLDEFERQKQLTGMGAPGGISGAGTVEYGPTGPTTQSPGGAVSTAMQNPSGQMSQPQGGWNGQGIDPAAHLASIGGSAGPAANAPMMGPSSAGGGGLPTIGSQTGYRSLPGGGSTWHLNDPYKWTGNATSAVSNAVRGAAGATGTQTALDSPPRTGTPPGTVIRRSA